MMVEEHYHMDIRIVLDNVNGNGVARPLWHIWNVSGVESRSTGP